MATKWIKLEGEEANLFNSQYQEMLRHHKVTEADFTPALFVRYLLEVRAKSLKLESEDSNA